MLSPDLKLSTCHKAALIAVRITSVMTNVAIMCLSRLNRPLQQKLPNLQLQLRKNQRRQPQLRKNQPHQPQLRKDQPRQPQPRKNQPHQPQLRKDQPHLQQNQPRRPRFKHQRLRQHHRQPRH